MARGELFILSAPSGAGKTTLIHRMFESRLFGSGSLAFSVSHTTRPPRTGEKAGKDYHFVDQATFEGMIGEGRFLEWARVHDHHYGTSYDEVLPRLAAGVDVVLDIDVQGAGKVLESHPEAHGIFIMPPSYAVLAQRLNHRGLDEAGAIDRRLKKSLTEIQCFRQYGYIIINDDAERASEMLAAIVLEKRQQRERMQERVDEVLADFARVAADQAAC